jgi:hypothetical protein
MARPLGIVRLALKVAAAEQPGTIRDLAVRAQVGYATANFTVKNMAQKGDLVPVGKREVSWRAAPVQVYGVNPFPESGPVPQNPPRPRPDAELQQILLRVWR